MNKADKQLLEEYQREKQAILARANNPTIDNGNGHSDKEPQPLPALLQNEEALTKLTQSIEKARSTGTEDSTKFTILRDLSDESKLNYHSEFRDWDEVLQMNRGRTWINLCRVVYTNEKKIWVKKKTKVAVMVEGKEVIEEKIEHVQIIVSNSDRINRILKVYSDHFDNHLANMVSYQRKRELSLVHALKNDDSVIKTGGAINAMLGTKK